MTRFTRSFRLSALAGAMLAALVVAPVSAQAQEVEDRCYGLTTADEVMAYMSDHDFNRMAVGHKEGSTESLYFFLGNRVVQVVFKDAKCAWFKGTPVVVTTEKQGV